MIPQHGYTSLSDPAYNISVSQMTFRPGDQIKGIVMDYLYSEFHSSTVY